VLVALAAGVGAGVAYATIPDGNKVFTAHQHVLSTSRPTDPGTGWIAIGRESTGGNAGSWAVQTWVVCATVGP
jgi:hypothetical protein